jgi:hypothetical protein
LQIWGIDFDNDDGEEMCAEDNVRHLTNFIGEDSITAVDFGPGNLTDG